MKQYDVTVGNVSTGDRAIIRVREKNLTVEGATQQAMSIAAKRWDRGDTLNVSKVVEVTEVVIEKRRER